MNSKSENNKEKLNDFFKEEYHSLKAYVNSKLKASINRDAEDIIQDVALKLFSGADRYSPINNVAGFVYHSIKNKIIDIMRMNRSVINYKDQNETKLIEFTELIYDKSDSNYSEQLKDELKKSILSLKPNYRDVIIAIDFEGYTYKDISLETGIPLGTLMSRRHRAISLLYKKLETKNIN
ncbi:RNA polymerase subunit sigma-24 [Flavivirga aquatica]|uniref:RNA polymerase subunit sigma-24 n=1 Tax=Flavivirga aquatica TaxID=1849968 RepID=A0A1E5SJM1_9FLAO|nr:RNA polymerase sigma factor [Flavivirga aquatica]OEJ99329.1 RNA polymerase subunit sigma-24 [Flavivirga aquatica]